MRAASGEACGRSGSDLQVVVSESGATTRPGGTVRRERCDEGRGRVVLPPAWTAAREDPGGAASAGSGRSRLGLAPLGAPHPGGPGEVRGASL